MLDDLVHRALLTARSQLGMDVGYFSEFVGTEQVIRDAAGDGPSFGLVPGMRVPLADSYCQRVIDGRLASLVPDTGLDPEVRDLPATAEAGLVAYVGVPLALPDGRLYGTLCCASHTADPRLAERDLRLMKGLAGRLMANLERDGRL